MFQPLNIILSFRKDLITPYTADIEKLRAIFIWITYNIAYDYKSINKGKEVRMPACEPGIHCEMEWQEWERKYLNRVLKKKKAICDGYARLIRKMCSIAGIRAEIIGGYTKTKPYQVGMTGMANHAWNAVWIDSAYHLLDATWAAGGCEEDEETGKLLKFKRSFENYYWCTSFQDLSRNHYPKEAGWVMEPNYTKDKYAANPYYSDAVIGKIQLLNPYSGMINAKVSDTIHFSFNFIDNIRSIQINSNIARNPELYTLEKVSRRKSKWVKDTLALKKQQYIPFKRNGNHYEFDYIITSPDLYYMDILFDYNRAMRFKIIIKGN